MFPLQNVSPLLGAAAAAAGLGSIVCSVLLWLFSTPLYLAILPMSCFLIFLLLLVLWRAIFLPKASTLWALLWALAGLGTLFCSALLIFSSNPYDDALLYINSLIYIFIFTLLILALWRACVPRSFTLANLFRHYVHLLAGGVLYPLLFISAAILISSFFASYLLWGSPLRIDTDPNLIWVPPGSTTFRQKALFDAAFDPFFRVSQVFITQDDGASDASDFGVLQQQYLAALLGLQVALQSSATASNVTLSDVCFRLEKGGPCLIQSPLNYFQSNPAFIQALDDSYIQQMLSCSIPKDLCTRVPAMCDNSTSPPSPSFIACVKDGVPMMKEVVLGKRIYLLNRTQDSVCDEKLVSAKSLVLTLLLDSTPQRADDAAAWEKEVFLPLVQGFAFPGLRASYMAERSISDALVIVDEQNQYVVVVSYCAMFIYIIFALGKFPHPLAMRSSLGLQGVIIVIFSVLTSLGIWTMAGEHITMIVNEVVPFLILAIGVDNMFIVTRAFDRRWWGPLGSRARLLRGEQAVFVRPRAGSQSAESSVTCGVDAETALSEALAEVGPTMFAAALCEIVAFIVGITMDIPALTQFCSVAALAVGVNFFLQMLWFVPAVLMDAWRQDLRCLDMAPCITLRGPGEPHTRCNICCARSVRSEAEGGAEVTDVLGYGASGMGMDVGLDRGYARFGPWQDGARAAMEDTLQLRAAAGGGGAGGHVGRGMGIFSWLGRGVELPSLREGLLAGDAAAADASALHIWGGSLQFAAGGSSGSGTSSNSSNSSSSGARSLRLGQLHSSSLSLPPFGSSPRMTDDTPDPDKRDLLECYGVGGDEPGGPPTTPKQSSAAMEDSALLGLLGSDALPASAFVAAPPSPTLNSQEGRRSASPTPPATPSRSGVGGEGRSRRLRPLPLKPTGCLCLSPYFWGVANRGNFVRRFMSHFYIPCLLSAPVRVLVGLLWVAAVTTGVLSLTGSTALNLPGLQLGLEQQLILPTGSYLGPYFSDLAHLGDAGPPAYLVLQNINYTHPRAFAAIQNLSIRVGSDLTNVLVPPVYSWVGDFQLWNLYSPPAPPAVNKCPPRPDLSTTPLASAVAFFVYNLTVTGSCCQAVGYCGGAYATDVQFLWGVPKQRSASSDGSGGSSSSSSNSALSSSSSATQYISADGLALNAAPGAVTRIGRGTLVGEGGTGSVYEEGSPTGFAAGRSPHMFFSRTRVVSSRAGGGVEDSLVDDGGCNLTAGYVSHAAVAAAHRHAHGNSARLSHRLQVPYASAVAAAFPPAMLAAFARGEGASRFDADDDFGGGGSVNGSWLGLMPCHIAISRLRTQHVPLRNQRDFIQAKLVMQNALQDLQGSLPVISDFGLLGLPQPPDSSTAPTPGAPGPYTDNTHTAWLPAAPGGAAFPYSLVYVYYEQYGYIRGVAFDDLIFAVLAVFLACLIVSSLAVALTVLVLVSSLTLCVCGWTWALNPHGTPDPYGSGPYGVDINAVFVVNLITATGLGVEFLIHITAAYVENIRTERVRQASKRDALEVAAEQAARREEDAAAAAAGVRARVALWWQRIPWLTRKERTTQAHGALVEMGSSVVTGITFTKLVGVLILAFAPSMLFRLYYFRIYLGIIVMGAFHGLALIPVLLATFGLPEV